MEYEYAIKVLAEEMTIDDVPIMFRSKTRELLDKVDEVNAYKADKEAKSFRNELMTMATKAMMSMLAGNDLTVEKSTYKTKINALTDTVAVNCVDVFPVWSGNSVQYDKDDRVSYNGVLYKVLQAHTSQATWTPTDAPSLFAKVLTSNAGEILDWEQPDSTNAYMKGDKVKYNGKVYESLIDNNVWSPDGYPAGWKEIND